MMLIRVFLCLILLCSSLQSQAKTEFEKETEKAMTELQYILSIWNKGEGLTNLKEYKPKTKVGEYTKDSILTSYEDSQNFSKEMAKLSPLVIETGDFDKVKSLEDKKNKIETLEKILIVYFNKIQNKFVFYDQETKKTYHLDAVQSLIAEMLKTVSDFKENQIAYANYLIENNSFVASLSNPSIISVSAYSTETLKEKSSELLTKTNQYAEARWAFVKNMEKLGEALDKSSDINIQELNTKINQNYSEAG